ncbi:ArsR/SmtB family transcription factor [Sphingobium rhizovicinum]|uniref:ArsR/SmtB family transcription factor n=1 Tax=Sphingobium rhizovicinum TaxID=432308 RepID=A0ABV7NA53_9SPHN
MPVTRERNVSEIGEATDIVQPALSQQLGELRRANLVQTRKEAKLVWYALADEGVALCVRTMEAIFGGLGKVEEIRPSAKPERRHHYLKGWPDLLKCLIKIFTRCLPRLAL